MDAQYFKLSIQNSKFIHVFVAFFQVYLHNAAWKSNGRKFEVIASFSETLSFANWLNDDEHVFPNTQYALNQRKLVISTNTVRYF